MKKKIIYGCEARGDAQSPYLSRWTLLDLPFGALYLHRFHRSDADEMHDHPWSFWSLILWRGYVEETPNRCRDVRNGSVKEMEALMSSKDGWQWGGYGIGDSAFVSRPYGRQRKRVWPGMILRRPSEWVHRVELIDGKGAVTLVWRGRYTRQWGFWTKKGWQHWKDYFSERGC